MFRHRSLIFLISCFNLLFTSGMVLAQEHCGVVEYEKMRHQRGINPETERQFEQWMKAKITDGKTKNFQWEKSQANSYTIPVVVHVIHNGEAIGTGTNISDAQIASQIQVINDDYKRLNADKINTPTEFQSVASSIDIQFVLAKQDPEGLATSGITRTLGTKTSWTIADNYEFKALSYWPAEDYLNIWVVNLTGGLIGFAQLPVSDQLAGLENSSTDRLTDGVIVHYDTFGSGAGFGLESQFNLGRTATHEIGHFFGLRHIWGDGSNCDTDYVDDTPPQNSSTSGCPTDPQSNTCTGTGGLPRMFQNYLDYTNDACMNLFTAGQVARMDVIIQNSPRRTSLLTSPGATAPVQVANDLGIRQIISPFSTICASSVAPQIEVRNYGTNTITDAQVQLSINGTPVESKLFSSLNLISLQITNLSFSSINFTPTSSQQFSFQILQVNSGTDLNGSNNSSNLQVTVPTAATLPIIEPFNSSLPAGWQVINPDGYITWTNTTAPDNSPTNLAMYMNFHDYDTPGPLDLLLTPAFTLSNPLTSQLKFDLAYAQFPGESADELKVYALPACNPDLSQGILLYDKSGSTLATTSSTSNAFVPTSGSQWRKSEVISLSTLTNSTFWQLAFVAKNGYGNNLYVDNAIVSDQEVNDLAITGIVSPGLVHCLGSPQIQFSVKNFSTSTVTNFQLQRTLNGGTAVTQNFSGINLGIGEQQTFTLAVISLNNGANQLTLTIDNPNGLPDSSPANNAITFSSYLDQSTDASPLRQTFDNSEEVPWIIASPVNEQAWELITTNTPNKLKSFVYKGFSNTNVGQESWLVSPVLDLSLYKTQSLFFDLSYAQRAPANEQLKILGSDDCGATYKVILFDQTGSQFSVANSNTEWTPIANSDWKRQFVSLDTVSGKKNVRLAIVATNGHGNNLYVDNLEIFAGNDQEPPITTVPYQLYYSKQNTLSDLALTFNLQEKTDVRLQIFSLMGQIVADNVLPSTLNQTYYFDMSVQASGLYLFRLQIDDQVTTTKVYIGH